MSISVSVLYSTQDWADEYQCTQCTVLNIRLGDEYQCTQCTVLNIRLGDEYQCIQCAVLNTRLGDEYHAVYSVYCTQHKTGR